MVNGLDRAGTAVGHHDYIDEELVANGGWFAGINHQTNRIDRPEHVDVTSEVNCSPCTLDGMVGIFCPVNNMQEQ
jgi:translation elongation factor EF-G